MSDALGPLILALADPARRAMVERLGQGAAPVSELAGALGLRLPSAVKHLKQLEAAGLVQSVKSGRVRTAHLAPAALRPLADWIGERERAAAAALDRLAGLMREEDEGQ